MSEGRIRVCHVVNAVSSTSVPADIATAQAKYTDVDAGVLAWFGVSSFDDDDLVEVHDLGAPSGTVGLDAQSARRAWAILSDYDIVQTHHNHSGTFGKVIAYAQGLPIVTTEQNNHRDFTRKGKLFNAVTNALADEVTCVSETVLDSIEGWERIFLDGDHIHVIHNGVNLERVRASRSLDWDVREAIGIDSETTLVANAGRLAEQKGLATLIEAIARSRETVDVEATIAGQGPMEDRLKAVAREHEVSDYVHFLGRIERRRAYRMMDQADIYAMPSLWEGFSAAAVEALSIGTPCVFSNIDEFVRPFGDVARFHPVEDAAALAGELVELTTNDDLRATLSGSGRERAETYDIEHIAKKYQELYRSLV